QITPRQGDTFTVLDHWYTINDDGEWILEKSPGTTLTYTGQPFTAEAYTSDPGEYVLGIIVTDLLDNTTAEYVDVTIVEP
ncbi:MAG: hypothetical protein KDE58_26825, partial [Caldilineaceae bacterium]|nr:hypothetical protein [Caldilineaceae bacterium]